jgi:hypothetical protein
VVGVAATPAPGAAKPLPPPRGETARLSDYGCRVLNSSERGLMGSSTQENPGTDCNVLEQLADAVPIN